jgi:hypothetical protein
MELQWAQKASGVGRGTLCLEGSRPMRAQMIAHHAHLLRLGKVHRAELPHPVGKFPLGAARGDGHLSPPTKRLDHEAEVTGAVPRVFGVKARWSAWHHRPGLSPIAQSLAGTLIEADARPPRILRLLVQIEPVFHSGDNLGTRGREAPLFL